MLLERSQLAQDDQWNVNALYPSFDAWKVAFDNANRLGKTPAWPEIQAFKGRLAEGPQVLKECLEIIFSLARQLEKLYTYAHLRHDEDITNDQYKTAFNQIVALLHEFHQEISWMDPELLALPEATIQSYLAATLLAPYRFHIEKIVRVKKHMLSPENEHLLAMAGKALQAPNKAFSALNDADFKFGSVLDSKGNARDITHGTYGIYIREHDRILRERAFKQMHGQYEKYENTLCELLNGQVQAHLFNAKARKYPTCLDAALFPKNIDTNVYHSLIEAVHSKISSLHKYMKLRKKIMKVDELHMYDLYVPLTAQVDIRMTYKEAEDVVIQSVQPLGEEYQNILKKGLEDERWVDRYENKNKRSGAYSSGCYDSMPYILMNYKELLRDVFTLAHEAGHSMHSYLSHKTQPYHYADYPIFLAEVASTFNEELLTRLLLNRARSKEEKIYLVNQKIEDIRGTLFRQTMFAEFELSIHTMAEKNIPLTPKLLKETYRKLNQHYFGEAVVIDPEIDIEWARIPHFYYNFYVFQYATGISAALALAHKVVNDGAAARDAYLSFLKGGSSRYPIDLLKMAGVDMCSPAPVQSAIATFGNLVDTLEKLVFNEPI